MPMCFSQARTYNPGNLMDGGLDTLQMQIERYVPLDEVIKNLLKHTLLPNKLNLY